MPPSSQSSSSDTDSDVNSDDPVCAISRAPLPVSIPSARTAQRRMALQTPPLCILGRGCLPNSERSSLASARASSAGSADDEPSSPGWGTDTDTDTGTDADAGTDTDTDTEGASDGAEERDGRGHAVGTGGGGGWLALLRSYWCSQAVSALGQFLVPAVR